MHKSWFVALCLMPSVLFGQTREEVVRGDKEKVEAAGFWMYNDIPGAFEKAKETGKPIVVVFRCLPCHECVKLDDNLVDTDPVIRPLLEQFVCVRQVATNGLDLSLFQYDTDQSFAVFFLNADKTIYGRFGTRSHRTDWIGDVSLEGLGKALQGALVLHKNYEREKSSLQGKRGAPMEVASPERYPSLKGKYKSALNYQGDVVKSCIHCHQIGDAQREFYWHANKPIPEKVLYPYPHPKVVGLIMDPEEMAKVKSVVDNSPADRAGLRAGDQILRMDGQPMLSIADIQWVLHQTSPDGGAVALKVRRDNELLDKQLKLADDWRKESDLSWRVTTWGLRRIAAGGMVLESLTAEEKTDRGVAKESMALRVKRAGRYGPHAAARRAGIKEGDVLIRFDSQQDLQTEQQLLTYVVTNKKPGDKVAVKLLRGERSLEYNLPIQR